MMSAVIALAESIAVMSPVAVQGTKINLNYARDHSVEEGLDFVVSTNIQRFAQWARKLKKVQAKKTCGIK